MVKGLVYFVTYDHPGWRATFPVIKIGSTTNLMGRLGQLSTGSPIRLIPAGTIAAKDPSPLERSFHRSFTRERLNGEWFKLTSGMLKIIRTHPIIDDRFDELFCLDPAAPDAKDLEIQHLKDEIKKLSAKVHPKTHGHDLCESCKLPLKTDIAGFTVCPRCSKTYKNGVCTGRMTKRGFEPKKTRNRSDMHSIMRSVA